MSSETAHVSPVDEHVVYRHQGALFRVVSKEVSQLEAVYLQRKRSCDEDWNDVKKLGWAADETEV